MAATLAFGEALVKSVTYEELVKKSKAGLQLWVRAGVILGLGLAYIQARAGVAVAVMLRLQSQSKFTVVHCGCSYS